MSLLDYSRGQIAEMVEKGMMPKKNLDHYDICKALSEGKTQAAIAEMFDLSESRGVRFIKDKKCPDCGNTRKH